MCAQTITKQVKSPIGQAAFVDVETTGLSPATDEIIELSIVLFEFNRETGEILGIKDEYSGLREPSFPIPKSASRVNHITDEDVKGHELDMARVEYIIREAEFIIAHNASFDRSFIQQMFHSAMGKPWKCSMRHVKWLERGFQSRGLQNLIAAHGIHAGTAHRAAADVMGALQLLNQTDSCGVRYFLDIVKHRAMPRRRPSIVDEILNHIQTTDSAAGLDETATTTLLPVTDHSVKTIPKTPAETTSTKKLQPKANRQLKLSIISLVMYAVLTAIFPVVFSIMFVFLAPIVLIAGMVMLVRNRRKRNRK